jgi:hypothetical protein
MPRTPRIIRDLIALFVLAIHAVRFLGLCFRLPITLAAENLYLRKQLAMYQERNVKPKRATNTDRLILVWLSRWFDWRKALAKVCGRSI